MHATEAISVTVVDDHAAVREGIRSLLEAEPEIGPVGAVADADAAMSLARERPARVAVLDYQLPDEDGLSLCLRLKSEPCPPRVLIYSGFADDGLALRAVIAGADAVLPKGSDPDDLPRVVRALARGERSIPALSGASMRSAGTQLDPEDLPILGMLVHGTPPAQIAGALSMSEDDLARRRAVMLARLRR